MLGAGSGRRGLERRQEGVVEERAVLADLGLAEPELAEVVPVLGLVLALLLGVLLDRRAELGVISRPTKRQRSSIMVSKSAIMRS
jgi:hypothetical protein